MTSKPKEVKMPLNGRVASYATDYGMGSASPTTRAPVPIYGMNKSNTGAPTLLGGI